MGEGKRKAEIIVLSALLVIYLIVLFKMTIFRGGGSEVRNTNLVPFVTIAEYIKSIFRGNRIVGIFNILGNLIIFFPLGFISSLLFPKMRKLISALILAFLLSLIIEVFQYLLACGRADIDDIILNSLGGAVGYWFYLLTSKLFKHRKYAIIISALVIGITCIGFFAVNDYGFLFGRSRPDNFPIRSERIN